MFILKIFVSLNLLSTVRSHLKDDDLIIEPLDLFLNSSDSLGILYCNSQVPIAAEGKILTASFGKPVEAPPAFGFRTETHNSTTLKILIKPNNFIGANYIYCHWNNNITYEKPGIIELKEPCRAYDYLYVECQLHAPVIARGFQNGFRKLFDFTELTTNERFYHHVPELIKIVNNEDLIFRFKPLDRGHIPKDVLMNVNLTLAGFGSSIFTFFIRPKFTTRVDFRIENILSTRATIHIKYNKTGAVSNRLCSGYIQSQKDSNRWEYFSNVTATSNDKIELSYLRPSTEYQICLRCYHKLTDDSFDEKHCQKIITESLFSNKFFVAIVIIAGVLVILIVLYVKRRIDQKKQSASQTTINQHDPLLQPPVVDLPVLREQSIGSADTQSIHTDRYEHFGTDFNETIGVADRVCPDTRDLTCSRMNMST
ncbi:unnamed protein product [Adineta ricciae]|uniref:Fibronectin type-III domain-containing protein n=1 Tax=Adineta ricciae TaxID=249248 RepID=A0A813RN24_ADIRI|nr:unnamed protein product [Adineta ricciae]